MASWHAIASEAAEYAMGLVFFPGLFIIFYSIFKAKLLGKRYGHKEFTLPDIWDLAIKLVTAIMSLLTFLSGLIIALHCPNILTDLFWYANAWTRFTTGYYIYDFFAKGIGFGLDNKLCKVPGENLGKTLKIFIKTDKIMAAHHVFILGILYPTILYVRPVCCDFFIGSFYVTDMSIPFIQVHHILRRLQFKGPYYTANGVFMTILFFFSRILLFGYLYYRYGMVLCGGQCDGLVWASLESALYKMKIRCHIGTAVLVGFQLYWFYLMIKGMFVHFTRKIKTFPRPHGD